MGYKLVFFNRNSVFANKRFINEGIIKRAFFTPLKGVKKRRGYKAGARRIRIDDRIWTVIDSSDKKDVEWRFSDQTGGVIFHFPPHAMLFWTFHLTEGFFYIESEALRLDPLICHVISFVSLIFFEIFWIFLAILKKIYSNL